MVAVAFAKTEVLQVALFATVFLSEVPTLWAGVAMAVSTVGVLMLSAPQAGISALAGAGARALSITSGNSTVKGLAIYNWGTGILLASAGGNVVAGNFIGTDASGTVRRSNGTGVDIETSGNVARSRILPCCSRERWMPRRRWV